MNEDSRHFQYLSVMILGFGTAAVGFGLFGTSYYTGNAASVANVLFLVGSGFAVFYYFGLLIAVGNILIRTAVCGQDVWQGPLYWMTQLMIIIALIFVVHVGEAFAVSVSEDRSSSVRSVW